MFNGEGELTGVDSTATYGYDGHRWRVQKTVSGTTTTYVYSGSKVIAEYSGGSLSKEYVYSGNRLLATIAGSAITYHYPDQLSNRLETDAGGNVVRTFGHLPFGDLWYETGAADKWKFTGYERDNQSGESGLDYALNRFYSSTYGRFQSPDLLDGSLGMPQSWNRYAYTRNDPGNFIDPSGLAQEKLAQVNAPVNSIDEFDLLNAFFVSVNAQFGDGWSPVITGSQTYYSYLSPGPGQPPYETIPQQVIFYTWVYTTTDFSSLGTLGDLFSTLFGSSSGSVPILGTGGGSGGGGQAGTKPQQPPNRKVPPPHLTQQQCNQLNQGLNRLNDLVYPWLFIQGLTFPVPSAMEGYLMIKSNEYINNKLCDGPPVYWP